jgi:hypothetical protein
MVAVSTSRLIAIVAGAAVVSGSLSSLSRAQTPAGGDVMYHALQIVAMIEETEGCDISLHGAPRLDELTDRWLVAYSGAGERCDDVGAALQAQGVPAEISFFRRPNGDEVKALIGRMRASVRRGFPCLIVLKGDPQFDQDADLWAARYYASGEECDNASGELERQGQAFGIAFRRIR